MIELILRILLGIVSLICFSGGINLLIKGVDGFLPKTISPPPVLDNVFRFLSGLYFSMGFLISWVAITIHTINELNYLIGSVIVCAGLGRLYSRIKVGSAGKDLDRAMWLEIILGITIVLLQYFR